MAISVLSIIVDSEGYGEACIMVGELAPGFGALMSDDTEIVNVPFYDVGEPCECMACAYRAVDWGMLGHEEIHRSGFAAPIGPLEHFW